MKSSLFKQLTAFLAIVPMTLQAQQTNVYRNRQPVQLEDVQALPDMPTFEEIKVTINQNQQQSEQIGVTYEEFLRSHLQLALKNPADFIGREASLHRLLIEAILQPAGSADQQAKELVQFAAESQMRIPQGYYDFLLGLKPEVREKFHRAIEVDWETRPTNEGLFLALMNQHQFKSPATVLALNNLLKNTPPEVTNTADFFMWSRDPLALLEIIEVFNTVLNTEARLKLGNSFNYRLNEPIGSVEIRQELERDPRLKKAIQDYKEKIKSPQEMQEMLAKIYDVNGSIGSVLDLNANFDLAKEYGTHMRLKNAMILGVGNAVFLGVASLIGADRLWELLFVAAAGSSFLANTLHRVLPHESEKHRKALTQAYHDRQKGLRDLFRWNGRLNIEKFRKTLTPFLRAQEKWLSTVLDDPRTSVKKPLLQFYEQNLKPSAVSCSRVY